MMIMKSTVLVMVLVLFGRSMAQESPVVGPVSGSLVIVGGGGKEMERILGRFVELAGGKRARIVVVTTAASSNLKHNYDRSWTAAFVREKLGVAEVTVLHTHDPKVAETEEFVKPIKRATGVWFGGGRQWRLTRAYGGTRSEREFHRVLERGGVIGGSSAGATIQGSFLARGDTSGNTIMVGDVQRGFGFMRNTAIDQHLIARGRERDLVEVLEDPEGKMRREFDRAALLGIGIDEDVAIVVEGDRFEVIGKEKGAVLVYDPRKWRKDTPVEEKWETIRTGGSFDLRNRKVLVKGSGAR
ncbi:MAG: peptidase S51 [Roseibacillus sp.]|nr:peptidase S51 [Roseibacillus sp.]MBP35785.1 peptidase S51 [Roseibacillus sp.]MCP4731059.1 cyanophycinase [Roseibacillus sp.]